MLHKHHCNHGHTRIGIMDLLCAQQPSWHDCGTVHAVYCVNQQPIHLYFHITYSTTDLPLFCHQHTRCSHLHTNYFLVIVVMQRPKEAGYATHCTCSCQHPNAPCWCTLFRGYSLPQYSDISVPKAAGLTEGLEDHLGALCYSPCCCCVAAVTQVGDLKLYEFQHQPGEMQPCDMLWHAWCLLWTFMWEPTRLDYATCLCGVWGGVGGGGGGEGGWWNVRGVRRRPFDLG